MSPLLRLFCFTAHLLSIYTVCSFKDVKKKNPRMTVQLCCSAVFVFMNESSAWVLTGFGIAHFSKTSKIQTFPLILYCDGEKLKQAFLLKK